MARRKLKHFVWLAAFYGLVSEALSFIPDTPYGHRFLFAGIGIIAGGLFVVWLMKILEIQNLGQFVRYILFNFGAMTVGAIMMPALIYLVFMFFKVLLLDLKVMI